MMCLWYLLPHKSKERLAPSRVQEESAAGYVSLPDPELC